MEWRIPAVEAALGTSREVWIETTGLVDPECFRATFRAYGLDPTRTLSSRLDPQERAALSAALALTGLPPATVEPMRPWFATLVLSTASIVAVGFDPALGPDLAIMAEAEAAGARIRGFETVEAEVHLLAGMPEATGRTLLRRTIADAATGGHIADIARLWLDGDVPGLAALVFGDSAAAPPEYRTFHRLMFVERNRAWATQLLDRLAGSGTGFVVVGAGHLVGPDSVVAMLEAAGVAVERLQ